MAWEPETNWRVSTELSCSTGTSDQRVWRASADITKEYRECGRKILEAGQMCCKVSATEHKLCVRER